MFSVLKDRDFLHKMLAIAIPISLQSIISFGVNLMDTVMVGKFGEMALSATSLSGSFYMIFSSISMGLGCGAAVITAQYWGKRDKEPIREMTAICFKLTLIISALFCLAGMLFPEAILRLYTTDESVITGGAGYLRVLSTTFIIYGMTNASTQILRSVGMVRIPLIATIGSFLVNVFFNWVLIFGKLGFPRLELVGAAWGTAIARVFEFAVICGYLFFRDESIGFRFRHFSLKSAELRQKYLKTGVPVLISDLVMILGVNLTAMIIGHIGAAFTAANSIAQTVSGIIHSLFSGVSGSSSVLTGNTIGEGKYEKAYQYGVGYLLLGTIFGIAGGVVLFFIKAPILAYFDVSDETAKYASQMLNVICCGMFLQLVENMITKGILRGGGDTKFLIFADCAFAYIAAAPLGALSAFVWHWPVWLIFICTKSDTICKLFVCGWRFFSKKWIRDVTVEGSRVEAVQL